MDTHAARVSGVPIAQMALEEVGGAQVAHHLPPACWAGSWVKEVWFVACVCACFRFIQSSVEYLRENSIKFRPCLLFTVQGKTHRSNISAPDPYFTIPIAPSFDLQKYSTDEYPFRARRPRPHTIRPWITVPHSELSASPSPMTC